MSLRPQQPFGRPNYVEATDEQDDEEMEGAPSPLRPPPLARSIHRKKVPAVVTTPSSIALPQLPRPVVPLVMVPTPAVRGRPKDRRESLLHVPSSWWNAQGQDRTNPPSDRCFKCCDDRRTCNVGLVGYPCSECERRGPAVAAQCKNGVPTVRWEDRIREEDRVARANDQPLGYAPTAVGPPGPGPSAPTVAAGRAAANLRATGSSSVANPADGGVQGGWRGRSRGRLNEVSDSNIRRAALRDDRPARRRSASPEGSSRSSSEGPSAAPGLSDPPGTGGRRGRLTGPRCKQCERSRKRCNDARPCDQCLRRGILCEERDRVVRATGAGTGTGTRGSSRVKVATMPQPTPAGGKPTRPYKFGRCERCKRLRRPCGDERPCNRCSKANAQCIEQDGKAYPVNPGQSVDEGEGDDAEDDEDLSMYDNGRNRLGDDEDTPMSGVGGITGGNLRPEGAMLQIADFDTEDLFPASPRAGSNPFESEDLYGASPRARARPARPLQNLASRPPESPVYTPGGFNNNSHDHHPGPFPPDNGYGHTANPNLGINSFDDMMNVVWEDWVADSPQLPPGQAGTLNPFARVADAPRGYHDLHPRERTTPFYRTSRAVGGVAYGEGFGGNQREAWYRPFWEMQVGEASWAFRARAAQDDPNGPTQFHGQQFDPPFDLATVNVTVPTVVNNRRPGDPFAPFATYSYDGSLSTMGAFRWPFPEIDPVNNERPLNPLTYQDLEDVPCSEEEDYFRRISDGNSGLPCGKIPSKECEVEPLESLRHRTIPMQTCHECHEDQLRDSMDRHQREIERTKSWLCVDCSNSARAANATRPQCNCTASRMNSWLCHAHREQIDGRVEGAVLQAEE
ncbi:hypothetical protein LZ554_003440 [Drepanopeziza brunnea f. sp. 'monogermtubi']|nr:hypothetical protein LZ554_003440 [Drepanopeziza brunnea f. sp. 'monogermtubi']